MKHFYCVLSYNPINYFIDDSIAFDLDKSTEHKAGIFVEEALSEKYDN